MIKKVGVVGLGTMGRSIACCLLSCGHEVIAVENNPEKRTQAKQEIIELVQQLIAQQFIVEPAQIVIGRLKISDNVNELKGLECILETITEDIYAKKELFNLLEEVLSHTAIIGSNTSAIPISFLQAEMKNPERLIGIHWGEPAHISRFMEVILGDQSSIVFAEIILAHATKWGKEPVLVRKDINGFIANRLMYALFREAMYLVDNGYATIKDIDRACNNDIGLWMGFAGPFRYMDLTGIAAYAKVMQHLWPDLSKESKIPKTFREIFDNVNNKDRSTATFYSYREKEKLEWERNFLDYSTDIKKLTDKYKLKISEDE
jgi:3-hydroxybutyryl-CoA dehydrogenase